MVKFVNPVTAACAACLLAALAAAPQWPREPASTPPPKPAAKDAEEPPQVIRVDVNLVNVYFSIRDRKGAYVSGLTQEDIEVYEDGKVQEIKFFARETDQPLTLGLLVDVSRSQEALIEEERRASYQFFSQVLRPKDMAFLISFGADTELLQDFTNSLPLLQKALAALRLNAGVAPVMTPSPVPVPGGGRGTVLYEAVWLAATEKLRSEVGRKAIVLITDGNDVGSRIKIDKAIEEAQRSDAIIYSVLYEDPRYTSWVYGGQSGEGPMKRMAEETGGRIFRVDRRTPLSEVYATIQNELRSQYALAYTPSNTLRDGGFRRIEIRLKDRARARGYKVQARKGYYAPRVT
jgi:VWFA-related protein